MRDKMLRLVLCLLGLSTSLTLSAQTPSLIEIPYEDWQQGAAYVEAMILEEMPEYTAAEMLPEVCNFPVSQLHEVTLAASIPDNGICQGISANLDCDGSIQVWRYACDAFNDWCDTGGNDPGGPAALYLPSHECEEPYLDYEALLVEVTPGDKILTFTSLSISGIRPYYLDCDNKVENKLEGIEVQIINSAGEIVEQTDPYFSIPPSSSGGLQNYTLQLSNPITLIPDDAPALIRFIQCSNGTDPDHEGWLSVFGWSDIELNGYCNCGICGDMSWYPMSEIDFDMIEEEQPFITALYDKCGQELEEVETPIMLLAQGASQTCLDCDDYCPTIDDLFIISPMGDTLYHHDTLYLDDCLGYIPSPEDFQTPIPGQIQMLTVDKFFGTIRTIRWKWWGGGCPDVFFRIYIVYDEDCSDYCPDNDDLFIVGPNGEILYHHDTLFLDDCLGYIPSPEDFQTPIPGQIQMLTVDQFFGTIRTIRWKWWGGDCPDVFFRIYIVYDEDCSDYCPNNDDLFIVGPNGEILYHHDTLYLDDCLGLIPTPEDFQTPIPGQIQMLTIDSFVNDHTRLIRWKWWGGGCPDLFFRLWVVYCPPGGGGAGQAMAGNGPGELPQATIPEKTAPKLKVWPNPAQNELMVVAPGGTVIRLISTHGQEVKRWMATGAKQAIPVHDLPNDLYILTDGSGVLQKVLIVR